MARGVRLDSCRFAEDPQYSRPSVGRAKDAHRTVWAMSEGRKIVLMMLGFIAVVYIGYVVWVYLFVDF